MRAGYEINYLNPYGRGGMGKFARIRTCECGNVAKYRVSKNGFGCYVCDLCLGEMEDEREREERELQEAENDR